MAPSGLAWFVTDSKFLLACYLLLAINMFSVIGHGLTLNRDTLQDWSSWSLERELSPVEGRRESGVCFNQSRAT